MAPVGQPCDGPRVLEVVQDLYDAKGGGVGLNPLKDHVFSWSIAGVRVRLYGFGTARAEEQDAQGS